MRTFYKPNLLECAQVLNSLKCDTALCVVVMALMCRVFMSCLLSNYVSAGILVCKTHRVFSEHFSSKRHKVHTEIHT